MSTELPSRAKALYSSARITIVAASYNEKFTSALLEKCLDELRETAKRIAAHSATPLLPVESPLPCAMKKGTTSMQHVGNSGCAGNSPHADPGSPPAGIPKK